MATVTYIPSLNANLTQLIITASDGTIYSTSVCVAGIRVDAHKSTSNTTDVILTVTSSSRFVVKGGIFSQWTTLVGVTWQARLAYFIANFLPLCGGIPPPPPPPADCCYVLCSDGEGGYEWTGICPVVEDVDVTVTDGIATEFNVIDGYDEGIGLYISEINGTPVARNTATLLPSGGYITVLDDGKTILYLNVDDVSTSDSVTLTIAGMVGDPQTKVVNFTIVAAALLNTLYVTGNGQLARYDYDGTNGLLKSTNIGAASSAINSWGVIGHMLHTAAGNGPATSAYRELNLLTGVVTTVVVAGTPAAMATRATEGDYNWRAKHLIIPGFVTVDGVFWVDYTTGAPVSGAVGVVTEAGVIPRSARDAIYMPTLDAILQSDAATGTVVLGTFNTATKALVFTTAAPLTTMLPAVNYNAGGADGFGNGWIITGNPATSLYAFRIEGTTLVPTVPYATRLITAALPNPSVGSAGGDGSINSQIPGVLSYGWVSFWSASPMVNALQYVILVNAPYTNVPIMHATQSFVSVFTAPDIITKARIVIENPEPDDILSIGSALAVGMNWSYSPTGVLTITGNNTRANYLAAIRLIRFAAGSTSRVPRKIAGYMTTIDNLESLVPGRVTIFLQA